MLQLSCAMCLRTVRWSCNSPASVNVLFAGRKQVFSTAKTRKFRDLIATRQTHILNIGSKRLIWEGSNKWTTLLHIAHASSQSVCHRTAHTNVLIAKLKCYYNQRSASTSNPAGLAVQNAWFTSLLTRYAADVRTSRKTTRSFAQHLGFE